MEDLKPCPFCGGKALVFQSGGAWGARCVQRDHFTHTYGATADEARAAWNRRPSDVCDQPPERAAGWRPISEAPRDVRSFIVGGHWEDGSPWWNIGHPIGEASVYGMWDSGMEPTHWRPLPEPPPSLSDQEGGEK